MQERRPQRAAAAGRRPRTSRVAANDHRLNVRISGSAYDDLNRIAEEQGKSIADVLRDAIALQTWYRNNARDGGRLLIERDGKTRELISIG